MGSCGCEGTTSFFTFDGPGNYRYCVQIFEGCEYCGTGPSVELSRYDNCGDVIDNMHESTLLELDFDEENENTLIQFPIIDLDCIVREKLEDALNGCSVRNEKGIVEAKIDEFDAEGITDELLIPALRSAIGETVRKYIDELK